MLKIATILIVLSSLSISYAQSNAQTSANNEAQRRAEEEQQRQLREQAQIPLRHSLDPSRIVTVGLWPGPPVPCKLPKREEPYVCHRLLDGPAVIFSQLQFHEVIVARGDAALAKGERSWWLRYQPVMPLALAAGEVLYSVGGRPDFIQGDLVATIYR